MRWPHVAQPVTADKRVLYPAAVYHGGVVDNDTDAQAAVFVYDGRDEAGDLLDVFRVAPRTSLHHWMDDGVILKYGFYVDTEATLPDCVIYYDPTPRELG